MKKFKKLLSVVLMLALCLTLTPAQAAKAGDEPETSQFVIDVDWMSLTDAQLEEVVFGHWVDHNESDTEISKTGFSREGELLVAWKYTGTQTYEANTSCDSETGEYVKANVKAMTFEAGTNKYIIYPAFDRSIPMMHLQMDEVNIETGDSVYVVAFNIKMVNGGTVYDYGWADYHVDAIAADVLAGKTTTNVVEEPTVEEIPEVGEVPVDDTAENEEPLVAYIMITESGETVTELNLEVGEDESLEITGIDDFNEDNYSYTWISNAPEVAKVSQDGRVTAVAAGSATVTVSIVSNKTGETATITPVIVTVPTPVTEEDVTTEEPVEEPKEDVTTEEPVEEPKEDVTTEEPVEEPKEDTTETPEKTEDKKEVIEKTKDGREVYTGETVYIVKKGDCLWTIAKQLLGNGKKYTELFTRNNGIIEKATLIFPGQEIIVPAK